MKYDVIHTFMTLDDNNRDRVVVKVANLIDVELETVEAFIQDEFESPGGFSGTTISMTVVPTNGQEAWI